MSQLATEYNRLTGMKAYLITTGTVFALITVAHVWRIAEEGSRLFTEPVFLLLTVAAAGLSGWAWLLLRKSGSRR